MDFTVQTHVDGEWRDAADVEFLESSRGIAGATSTSYDTDYWAEMASVDALQGNVVDRRALSLRYPVDLSFRHLTAGQPGSLISCLRGRLAHALHEKKASGLTIQLSSFSCCAVQGAHP